MHALAAHFAFDRLYRLSFAVANRFGRSHPHLAGDFIGAAGLALWQSLLDFRGTVEAFKPSFAVNVAKWACVATLSSDRRHRRKLVDLAADHEDGGDFLAHLPDLRAVDPADAVELADLGDLLADLDERDRAIVVAKAAGESTDELGKRLGIGWTRVNQLCQRGLRDARTAAGLKSAS